MCLLVLRWVLLLGVLILPNLARAGTANAPSFADFESGSYNDWKIEGNAFGDRPLTSALFSGKIRGFGGKSFAGTLDTRRGNAATGKAVSATFTITKPMIAFKIGGGMHPGKACLNLIVDGQIVRTQTGDDSPQLIERMWDVSELAGKVAHFEIVDATTSEQRGYILVDDIAFLGAEMIVVPPLAETAAWIEIPVRVVHVVDSQGRAEFSDRSTAVLTPSAVEKKIVAVNEMYRSAKIRFTFDPKDFEVRRDDYLNLDGDPPAPGIPLDDPKNRPIDTGRGNHLRVFEEVGLERPDRVTILVHRGSEWRWDEQGGKWLFVVGFSRGGSGIRPDGRGTIRVTGTEPRIWAHELGHALGLPHTSRDGVDAPSKLMSEVEITRACQLYLNRQGNPEHPEQAIDGDFLVGIVDTPPDPGLGFWGDSPDLSRIVRIQLPGREPFSLFVSRNNMMAPKANAGGFTNGQIVVLRRTAEWWKAMTDTL